MSPAELVGPGPLVVVGEVSVLQEGRRRGAWPKTKETGRPFRLGGCPLHRITPVSDMEGTSSGGSYLRRGSVP